MADAGIKPFAIVMGAMRLLPILAVLALFGGCSARTSDPPRGLTRAEQVQLDTAAILRGMARAHEPMLVFGRGAPAPPPP